MAETRPFLLLLFGPGNKATFYSTFARQLDFFKVLPSHMKVLPGHYKGQHATSKGRTPLLTPVAPMGQYKQANEFQ